MGISVLSSPSNFDLHRFCGEERREIWFRVGMCCASEADLRADSITTRRRKTMRLLQFPDGCCGEAECALGAWHRIRAFSYSSSTQLFPSSSPLVSSLE